MRTRIMCRRRSSRCSRVSRGLSPESVIFRRFLGWLRENELAHAGEVEAIEKEIQAEIDASVAFAEAAEWEPLADLTKHVYAEA